MNEKQKYYQNKILYALSKIDYANSKIKNKSNNRELSKIYQVLMTYDGDVKLDLIMKMTGINRDSIVGKLKELRALGVLEWNGTYLTSNTEVKKKVDFKEWFDNLMSKLDKSDGVVDVDRGEQPCDIPAKSKCDFVDIELEDGMTLRVRKDVLKRKLIGGN